MNKFALSILGIALIVAEFPTGAQARGAWLGRPSIGRAAPGAGTAKGSVRATPGIWGMPAAPTRAGNATTVIHSSGAHSSQQATSVAGTHGGGMPSPTGPLQRNANGTISHGSGVSMNTAISLSLASQTRVGGVGGMGTSHGSGSNGASNVISQLNGVATPKTGAKANKACTNGSGVKISC